MAVYVFCKSWPSSADKRLLALAVLLFIPWAAKCLEKPLSLMRSSFTTLAGYFSLVRCITAPSDRDEELEAFVREARAAVLLKDHRKTDPEKANYLPRKLLLDYADNYSYRLTRMKCFCLLDDEEADEV